MTQREQELLEKKALDQLLSGKSLFGKEGAFAPLIVLPSIAITSLDCSCAKVLTQFMKQASNCALSILENTRLKGCREKECRWLNQEM